MRAVLLAGAPTAALDAAGNGAAHLAACAGHACLLKLLLRKVHAAVRREALRSTAVHQCHVAYLQPQCSNIVGLHAHLHELPCSLLSGRVI